jgi:hypothetical protein
MSTHSFPLIGIDRSGNQHEFEWPGASEKDAAEKGASFRDYVKVLSNDKRRKLQNYRKPLFESKSPSGIFTRPKSALALLLEDPFLKTGSAIVQYLRSKGFSVSLVDDKKTGKLAVHLTPGPNCKVKIDDRDALRNFVRPNTQLIIDTLRAETSPAPEPPSDTDPLKGKKLREIVLSVLPQMPTPFTKNDFAARLKAANYTVLAEDGSRVQNAITYCTRSGGEVTGVGRGKYAVREQFRHRKAAQPNQVASVPMADLSPEADAIDPHTVKASEAGFRVDDEPQRASSAAQAKEVPVAAPESTIQSVPPLVAVVLLDLASQAVAGPDDAGDLAAKLTEACATFESTMLDAVSALTATVKPVVERLNKQKSARQAFARLLARG